MKTLRYVFYFFSSVLMICFCGCANVVSPTGGPKDTIPPIVILEYPKNQSTNFLDNNINITFDEFVTLNNPNNNILISPPLEETPDYRLSNKTLVIKFKEPLKTETTYSINFGEAIKDLHEGNMFKDYSFVFSTGEIIDTLTLEGRLVKGEDHAPFADCFVMLYNDDIDSVAFDSLPYLRRPNYVTKSDKDGNFKFSGLKDDNYMIFALKDNNSNYLYDLPNEEIAFLDTLVKPIIVDLVDSTEVEEKQAEPGLVLYTFIKEDSIQKLLKKEIVEEGLMRFAFKYPAQDVKIEVMETLPDSFAIFHTHSVNYDTILWYYTPNKDSLSITINYDTLINDTTRMSLKSNKMERGRKKNDEVKQLNINTNINGGKLYPEQELMLSFKEPVTYINMRDTTWFITSKDTIINELCFIKADSFGLRYKFDKTLIPEETYQLIIPDSVFFSFKGTTNDTTKLSFSVSAVEEYGNLFVNVEVPDGVPQLIVELLDDKNKTLRRQIITDNGKVYFTYLKPNKYKLKAIVDKDANGQWSPGDFGKRLLPEAVYLHKDVFEIKANWDIDLEETWTFK